VKKPQWITAGVALVLTVLLYQFGRTVPSAASKKIVATEEHGPGDGHNHEQVSNITIDTILNLYKKELKPEQVLTLNMLENSITRGDVKNQQLHVYHQLSRFWGDTARAFEPYAWYEAEAARLENSEKSLTFAARLFLDNLQVSEQAPEWRRWKGLQAKDLFERSLKINPDNDSARVGIGACYLFGGISDMPMEGIQKIMEVVKKDSTNVYAQMTLAKGSVLSGQYDKAVTRLETVNKLAPGDIDATLMLADVYERLGEKEKAISWYKKSLVLAKPKELKSAIEKRIGELKK
jgi:tetratricopeptide (TPR) repeat protein